jgi:hypothetical protein
MSIQIIVASPYQYFSEWIGEGDSQRNTEDFVAIIKKLFDIELYNPWEAKEYYCEDLPSSGSLDLSELAYNISQEIQWQIDADLYLPYDFQGTKRVSIPCLDIENNLIVCSTKEFSTAIQIIDKQITPENTTAFGIGQILASYKEAVSISNKEKQPIFWSY